MIIRSPHENDLSQMVALLAQLGYILSLEEMRARLAAFTSKGHQIYVAELDGLVLGLIAFGCYELFRLDGCCCHVDVLIIDENHRGQGLGKQLLQLAENYARDNGAKIVELLTANHRRMDGTHGFYETADYKSHHHWDYTYFAKEL